MQCSDGDEWSSDTPGAPRQVILEPLLKKYGVDLVITGHEHVFEVVHPSTNGTDVILPVAGTSPPTYVDPPGPPYVVVGTGGALQRETFHDPQPTWSFVRRANTLEAFGYGALDVMNATHLQFSFHAVDAKGDFTFAITKSSKHR